MHRQVIYKTMSDAAVLKTSTSETEAFSVHVELIKSTKGPSSALVNTETMG